MNPDWKLSLFGLVALLFASTSFATPQATDVSHERRYDAGAKVSSSWTGVSFAVPASAVGLYDEEYEAFVLVAEDQSFRAVVEAASEASIEDLALSVLEGIAEAASETDEAATVQLLAGPEEGDGIVTASYLVGGTPVHGAARQGEAGNAAVVFAIGARAKEIVSEVASRMEFSAPSNQVATWRQQLGGTEVFSDRVTSDYSPGAGGSTQNSGTFTGSSSRLFTFCSNGQYGYEYSYKGYISVDHSGGGGDYSSIETSESDAHNGQWTMVANLMGSAFLSLESTDGRWFVHELIEAEEGLAIDRRLYSVSPSGNCN